MKNLLMILALSAVPACLSVDNLDSMTETNFSKLERTLELTTRIAARSSGVDQETLSLVANVMSSALDSKIDGNISDVVKAGLIEAGLDDPDILDLSELLLLDVLPTDGLYTLPNAAGLLGISPRGAALINIICEAMRFVDDSRSSK
jgi:hypothetical protein